MIAKVPVMVIITLPELGVKVVDTIGIVVFRYAFMGVPGGVPEVHDPLVKV